MPAVELPSEPLSSMASRVDPNMVLDLALEFSNTGAAYRGSFDWKKVYLGYWDPMACYGYAPAMATSSACPRQPDSPAARSRARINGAATC